MTVNQNAELCRDPLVQRAETLLPILRRQSRRAFVLELTGTPKAGKTTAAGAIRAFLRDAKYRVHLMRERAGECPLPMKGHVFFNAWTTCSAISELLEHVDGNSDIVILDRGLFDALVWIRRQLRQAQITKKEKRILDEFVLLDRWRKMIDAVGVLTTSPQTAEIRENIGAIVDRRKGSVMNSGALASYNRCLEKTRLEHGDGFNLRVFDTVHLDQRSVNRDVVSWLFDEIEKWVDPEIAILERSDAQSIFDDGRCAVFGRDAAGKIIKLIASRLKWRKRSQVPSDGTVVQIVAAGVLRNARGEHLVFRRSNDDPKAVKYGFETLWRGWHVAREQEVPFDRLMIEGLYRKWCEELHLADCYQPTAFFEPFGVAWVTDNEEVSRHLGVLYRVPVITDNFSKFIMNKEFRRAGRGHTMVGRCLSLDALRAKRAELEPWSQKIVDNARDDDGL